MLGAADADRLARLARFMGRHFYRERIVRLFAASRLLARARGADPLRLLDGPAFAAVLDAAELGSAATAEQVASLVEGDLRDVLRAVPYGADLIAYEGALFRAEAGPRRWRGPARRRARAAGALAPRAVLRPRVGRDGPRRRGAARGLDAPRAGAGSDPAVARPRAERARHDGALSGRARAPPGRARRRALGRRGGGGGRGAARPTRRGRCGSWWGSARSSGRRAPSA